MFQALTNKFNPARAKATPSGSSQPSDQPTSSTVPASTSHQLVGGPRARNASNASSQATQRPRSANIVRFTASGERVEILKDPEPPRTPTAADRQREQLRGAAGGIATIDLGAMRRNFRIGMAMVGGVPPGAVVKANGYGLGADIVGKTLVSEGCRDFFVARITEAVDLREALRADRTHIDGETPIDQAIAINVLDGNLAGADPELLIRNRITPVLNSLDQVKAWNDAGKARGQKLPAILQFDSGMHRAGMDPKHAAELGAAIARGDFKYINPQLIMTHLAKSGEADPQSGGPDLRTPYIGQPDGERPALRGEMREREPGLATKKQLENFEAICKSFPGIPQSIGASSTVFLAKDLEGGPASDLRKDMVRMGGTFHGQAPFDADSNPLEQVLTLTSKLAQIDEHPAGSEVGYSGRFVTDKPMTLATIPMGYADGLPRRANANGETRPYVKVGGQHKAEFVGAISMDMSSIDVSGVPPELRKPGTPVTLMGDGITPDHFADNFGTNASETQTKLAGRVFKEYLDADAPPRDFEPKITYEDAEGKTQGGSKFAKAWDDLSVA